jgi:serine/threonine protein kinase/tetratricopeptide (TPR) repeat protein
MAVESVFHAALAIANPQARAAYLDQACAGNLTLRQEVEELLAAHAGGSPLDRPPAGVALTGAYQPDPGQADLTKPGERIGPYKLLEKIGEGGMGEVWVAEQHEPIRRRVALKVIKPGMDSRAVLARFEAERQALAMMDHPHIAKVLDAGTTADRRPYFVMELVKGVPITEFCDARRLTPQQRLELFIPVCQAIQHAHQKGIIHRDIKPTNVLVELHDDRPVSKVIDFGVAKAIGQQLTEKTLYTGFGALVGTPAYMAPEQATFNALDVDTRADVYALGVLLYELLVGTPPFEPERLKLAALDEVLRLVREEEPPRPSTRLSTSQARASIAAVRQTDPTTLTKLVRGELDWVVMKALEKDRTRRYETASALAKDVERYLKDETVEACPPTLGYRVRKFTRKHRMALFWTAMVILILGGIAQASAWQAMKLRDALVEVQEQRVATLKEKLQADAERERAREAERKAVKEKERADREAKATKAVQEYLINQVLAAADPYKSKGTKLSVEDLLDRAAAAVGSSFAAQPEFEVAIREMLGRTFMRLGKYAAARTQVTAALDLRKRLNSNNHPETFLNENDLGEILHQEGKVAEAERLLRACLERSRQTLGEKHPVTLATYSNLGTLLWRQKRHREAEPLTRRAYELQHEILGPENQNTLVSLLNLGIQIRDQGRLTDAEPLMVKALQELRRVYGDNHPTTIAARNNLGSLRLAQRNLPEALRHYREALSAARAVLPDHHPNTLLTVNNVGYVLQQMGKLDEAETFYRWVVLTLQVQQPNHPHLLEALGNLAQCLEAQKKWEEAGKHRVELYQLSQRTLGIHHDDTLARQGSVLMNLNERKLWKEAMAWGETLLPLCQSIKGDTHDLTQAARLALAHAYLGADAPTKAEAQLRDWLKHDVKHDPPSYLHHAVTSMLGDALLGQKRYAEAEPLLLKGYQELKDYSPRPGAEIKESTHAAVERLVKLYLLWGNKDQQAKWQAVLDEIKAAESK